MQNVRPFRSRNFAILICLGNFFSTSVWAQPSAWSQYTPDHYLLGRGISGSPDRQDRLKEAREDARADLVKSIRVHISGRVQVYQREDEQAFQSLVESQNVSAAAMEILGVKYLTEEEEDWTNALAYLSNEDARRLHRAGAAKLVQEIEDQLDRARQLAKEGKGSAALQAYAEIYPPLGRLEDYLTILLVAGGEVPERPFSRNAIKQEIEEVENAPLTSLKEAAERLIRRMDHSGALKGRILVQSFVYGETEITSPFSRHFRRLLEVVLGNRPVAMTRSFRPRGTDTVREAGRQSNAALVLRGSYKEVGENIEIYALVVDIQTGQRVAAADIVMPGKLVAAAHLDLKPQNFATVLEEGRIIGNAEVEVVSGALRLELWTDKGRDNLLFEEGDTYKMYVRVNYPCTVRLLYHLESGTRVVMYENFTIPAHLVNRVVELPDSVKVAPPYGVERIQGFAYTKEPPPLKIRHQSIDGVNYEVVDETLAVAMTRYRGFIRVSDGRDENAVTHLTLTTMVRAMRSGFDKESW